MNEETTLTILGSGTSMGVPEIGCRCNVCQSTDRRDKRLRCSGLLEIQGTKILIDCGPDFRQQALRTNMHNAPDAVLLTHEHYDHIGGIDDLRPLSRQKTINLYGMERCCHNLEVRMPYCFRSDNPSFVPQIKLNTVTPEETFKVNGIKIQPLKIYHGQLPILGYRIGRIAWITDALTIPQETMRQLDGLDLLVMNALHIKKHPTHQTLDMAIENARRINARKTIFIHMSHYIGLHKDVEKILPHKIELAYDFMKIKL